MEMKKGVERVALRAAILILALTAALKMASLWVFWKRAGAAGLDQADPLFPFLSGRAMFALAIVLEWTVLLVLVHAKSRWIQYGSLAWLATVFAAYHGMMSRLGRSCHCTGLWPGERWMTHPALTLGLLIILLVIGWSGVGLALFEESRSHG